MMQVRPVPVARLHMVGAAAALAHLAGCPEPGFTEPQVLGGVEVAAETLNHGKVVYRQYCSSCHGTEGEGSTNRTGGKAPRDLTSGYFKFTSVAGDGLPLDSDLTRVIKRGIRGTQMAGHDLPDKDLEAVVQYLKTFSDRWRSEEAGTPVPVVDNPWQGKRLAAIRRGYEVYHTEAQCWTCHPAYATREQILNMSQQMDLRNGDDPRKSLKARENVDKASIVDTRYGKVLPPDFLSDRLPAAKGRAGLYRAIASGIGGTPMPTWFARLSNSDLWAVVHYVQELVRLRGMPAAVSMRYGLPAAVRLNPGERDQKTSASGKGN